MQTLKLHKPIREQRQWGVGCSLHIITVNVKTALMARSDDAGSHVWHMQRLRTTRKSSVGRVRKLLCTH